MFVSKLLPFSDAEFRAALAAAERQFASQRRRSVGPSAIAGLPGPPDMTQGYTNAYRTRELTRRAGWCLGPAGKMTEAEAEKACLAWNQHNDPPLPEDKVRKTVANIAKAEARKRSAATSSTLFRTDLGNARRLVKRHGENIRFIHEWRKWIIWSGNRWEVDNDGAVVRLAKETVTAMYSEALQITSQSRRDALIKHALKSQAESRLTAMVSLAESEIEVALSAKALDSNPWLVGVQNGVVELKTGKFRAGRREDLITKQASVWYDPNAHCPQWLKFLDTITGGDKLLQAYLQRAIGYTLTGSVREEVAFVLYGTGNNGKSTFRESVHNLFGDYALASDASLLIERKTPGGATEEIARLAGRRFVAVNETKENDQLYEARVKFITSQDTITARNLYSHFFDFFPTHKTFVTTNHKPIIRETDEGIWRRLHLVPFTITVPRDRVEKDFRERHLMPEMAGILNWAIEGALAYLNEGLSPPAAVQVATDEYRRDMDVVGQWLEERCVREPNANTPSSTAYFDYKFWADEEIGWFLSQIRWRRNLSDRGFEAGKGSHGQRVIKALRLKSTSSQPMFVLPPRLAG
jgi:putative DNA primase/helicase